MLKKLLLFVGGVFFLLSSFAQIPSGYYDLATGKTGEDLRAALRDITTNGHVKLPYTSSSFDVWDAYSYTDVRPAPNNTIIWDMYSDIPGASPAYTFTIYTNQCGTASNEGDCYSREHCMPNSWWGGLGQSDNTNPQYTDLHHLFPADQYVNSRKSNYIVAQTSTPTWTSTNGSKLGPCTFPGYTGTVFEPINEYKGDFARAYLYLATRYMNELSTWVTDYSSYDSKYIINSTGGNYKQWYIDMLISWNNSDPVSQKEIDRNNNIYNNTPQHNRNPYVDHPEYVCLVWGCASSPVITNIVSTPSAPNSTSSVSVSANVTDNVSVASVTLQWGTDGLSYGNSITMNVSGAPNYVTVSSIPAQLPGTKVTYRIVAIDNEGNTTTSLAYSYTTIKVEPTNYPTSISTGTPTSTSITLNWVDASTPVAPDGYLIKASSVNIDAITDPIDGNVVVNSLLAVNVAQGVQTVKFSGLTPATTYYFKFYPYTNSLANINYKTTATPPSINGVTAAGGTGSCATDLIISEYIEGSSNNKYLEISNNTGATVNLADYELRLFSNGSVAIASFPLSGTLDNQSTFVYKNSLAALYGGVATASGAVNFNGDDAIALYKISTSSYVDIFGRIGEDPGTAWSSTSNTTLDKTLVRKSSVTTGVTVNPSAGFPTLETEWTQYAKDDVSNLGAHTMTCPPTCSVPTVKTSSITFSAIDQNAITINWINGDGTNRIIVMNLGSPVAGTPINGHTYTANSVFGSGEEYSPEEFVVYNGSGSSVGVTNLIAGQTYYIAIFEYNCLPGSESYLSTPTTISQATCSIPMAPISASSSRDNICEGDGGTIDLSATGGSGTTLNWYTSSCGGTLVGTGTPLNIASPSSTTTYFARWENSCSNSSCASVTVNVKAKLAVSVLIEASANSVCEGVQITFSALPTNGGTNPSYKWQLNGTDVNSQISNTYSSNAFANGDQVKCVMTSSEDCVLGSPAISNSISLTVKNKPTTPIITQYVATQSGTLLHSNAPDGNQWYNSNGLISNATSQDFSPNSSSTYYDIVTTNGCSSDASNSIVVVISGINNPDGSSFIEVYPNPVSNELIIEIKGSIHKTGFQIFNSSGQIVYKGTLQDKTVVQTSSFPTGLYLVKFENGNTLEFKKIIKK